MHWLPLKKMTKKVQSNQAYKSLKQEIYSWLFSLRSTF